METEKYTADKNVEKYRPGIRRQTLLITFYLETVLAHPIQLAPVSLDRFKSLRTEASEKLNR